MENCLCIHEMMRLAKTVSANDKAVSYTFSKGSLRQGTHPPLGYNFLPAGQRRNHSHQVIPQLLGQFLHHRSSDVAHQQGLQGVTIQAVAYVHTQIPKSTKGTENIYFLRNSYCSIITSTSGQSGFHFILKEKSRILVQAH